MPVDAIDINACATAPIAADVGEAWVVGTHSAAADSAAYPHAADADPRTRAYLVAMPGPLADLDRRVSAYRADGGPAVLRICPGPQGHGFPLVPWAVSPIPEYCAREEIALVLDFKCGPPNFPWSDVVSFARAYSRLAVVALGAPLGGITAARALDAAANLIFDTGAMTAADAESVARLVRTQGAYRLAYGSGDARVAVSLASAGLEPSDAATILSGTATHLAAATWSSTHL